MREFLTPASDVDAMRLLTTTSPNLVIALEGEDDEQLLHDNINSEITLYVSSAGKLGLLKAAFDAQTEGIKHAIFVADRDFDDFSETALSYPNNVVLTHHHDCFVDIVFESLETLVRVVEHKLKNSKNAMHDPSTNTFSLASDIVAQAIGLAKHKAVVRAVATRLSIGLDFKSYSFFGKPTTEITSETIYNTLSSDYRGNTPLPPNASDLLNITRTEINNLDYSPVGDHDLIQAIRAILIERFNIGLSEDRFRALIVLTFTISHLSKAHWCTTIAMWTKQFNIDLFTEQIASQNLSALIPSRTH